MITKRIEEFSKKYNEKVIDILGSKYLIILCHQEKNEQLKDRNAYGYTTIHEKLIVAANDGRAYYGKSDVYIINAIKRTLRHEIFHAFMDESGLIGNALPYNGPWPFNEEMIDFVAIQAPKIFEVYNKLDLLTEESSLWEEKIKPKTRGRKRIN